MNGKEKRPETAPAPKAPDAPAPAPENPQSGAKTPRPDPTRYGDWEKNGRCIDF